MGKRALESNMEKVGINERNPLIPNVFLKLLRKVPPGNTWQ